MKIINRIIIFLILILLVISISSINVAFATSLDSIVGGADNFVSDGTNSTPMDVTELKPLSDTIYNILLVIGVAIAVIVGMIIGIRIITGSVSEKAQTKEMLIPYVAGCIVVFGAFGIWKLVVNLLSST